MKIKDKTKIRNIMSRIIWDYDVDPYSLFEVVIGKRESIGHFNSDRVLVRIMEHLSCYDLINLFGIDLLRDKMSLDIIKKIRPKGLQEKYEFIRKVLQGEIVSFSGWSPEYREKIKHTLLSNRWYRP